MARVEPALKPYQPSQRIIVPSTWSTCEWPRMWIAGPRRPLTVMAKRPRRGPMMNAPTRAAVPPTAWTTPEPAKSMTPLRKASGLPTDSHPASHHTHSAAAAAAHLPDRPFHDQPERQHRAAQQPGWARP